MSDVIREIRSIRLKTIIAEVKTFRNKISSNCKAILNIATELEDDNLNLDDMDPHLMRIVKRGKNEVISVIKKETAVVIPEINSFEDIKTFNITATRSLKKIGDSLGRQSRIIHHFAKKYANKEELLTCFLLFYAVFFCFFAVFCEPLTKKQCFLLQKRYENHVF